MINLQSEMQRAVQGFVAQIVELVRHSAVETLHIAFAGSGPAASSTDVLLYGQLVAMSCIYCSVSSSALAFRAFPQEVETASRKLLGVAPGTPSCEYPE